MSYESSNTRGRSTVQAGAPRPGGFTLAELLVVLGIIAILAVLLLPSMSQTLHVARDRICKNNLYRVGQVGHRGAVSADGTSADPFSLPPADAWTGPVGAVDKELLFCPEDPNHGSISVDDAIWNYYILQQTHDGKWLISNLGAGLGLGGGALQDGQLWADGGWQSPPNPGTGTHTGGHPCFCDLPRRAADQKLVAICSEARVLLTFQEGGQIKMESIVGCMAKTGSTASDHWLMKGKCADGALSMTKDQKVMQLGGKTCAVVDPHSPHYLNVHRTSYGMNDQVPLKMQSPQQMMIMDANTSTIPVGEAGWMSQLRYRHFGKVNYVGTGGTVLSASKVQLTTEYNRLEDKGDAGGSLWGRQASPLKD